MKLLLILTTLIITSCAQLMPQKTSKKTPKNMPVAKPFTAKQAQNMYYKSPKFTKALGHSFYRIKKAAEKGLPSVVLQQNDYYVCNYIASELSKREFRVEKQCNEPGLWEVRRVKVRLNPRH